MKLPFSPGLVVSCQALAHEPLHGAHIMARMAVAAWQGGAVAIRANSPEDIVAIKQAVDLPVIGINKVDYPQSPIYITPTLVEVNAVIQAGTDVVSIDATDRKRPGESLPALLDAIHRAGRLAMADVSTVQEGVMAARLGFDIVATTLSGYTEETHARPKPDFPLLRDLCRLVEVPVFAEGNISTPSELHDCFTCGAYAVVVGSAITRPQHITAKFANAYQEWSQRQLGEIRGSMS